jgi:hypothetical protein
MNIGHGKPKYSEKTCPRATLSITNPTWLHPVLNPGRRGEKSETNHLSYDAAFSMDLPRLEIIGTYFILCCSRPVSRRKYTEQRVCVWVCIILMLSERTRHLSSYSIEKSVIYLKPKCRM